MSNASGTWLRAGAARTDITPDIGIQLAGDIGRYRPTEEIRDHLFANALVLEHEKTRICILSLDLLAMGTQWSDRMRAGIEERYGIEREAVVVHVVQNHASPALGHCFCKDSCALMPPEHPWLRGGDDRYHTPTVEKCIQAVGQAIERLEPVLLAAGRGIDGRVAFNRRVILRDGTARMGGAVGDPQILQVEGPADPEVAVATLTNARGQVVAALLHHTSHPCHGYPHRFVIGDWPGAWVELMRKRFGEESVPLVINGCCGNVLHHNLLDSDFRSEYHQMAEKLAQTTEKVLGRMDVQAAPALAIERSVLRLPLRELSDEVVAGAKKLLQEHPEPVWLDKEKTRVSWDWVYAVMILDLKDTRDKDPYCDYEIQAVRIGDMALVTLMGEPFVEAQLEIKRGSPARYTFVAHFCNGYAGYIPTRLAFKGGGYETRTSNGSKFAADALELIVKEATRLVRKLF